MTPAPQSPASRTARPSGEKAAELLADQLAHRAGRQILGLI